MYVWHLLTGPINWLSLVCNVLVFVIPFIVYHVNKRLHEYGDPIWKKENNQHNP